ncbi:hypothetical protein B0I00_1308 [Novosphingobium kunmingense]|uniref:Uncharacterized protein n=1 Tax=Novosphingobium kunmingense TaxID=1211806 RepID=A0A2N0HJG2_9SPHN|nr:hypothetical protein [Novosphingobium kunmingense]PKB19080.1 hypothetical protein B0I00_1308 [Novosphingobium kunmingense]
MYRELHHLWWDSAALGFEASQVIGLRMARLAQGDDKAFREAERMVTEKISAAFEIHMMAVTGQLGLTPDEQAARTVKKLRRKVERNRKRLSSGG